MPKEQVVAKKQQEIYNFILSAFRSGTFEPLVFYNTSEKMSEVDDNSVQLIVTSPPYNCGKDYGVYDDSKTKEVYLDYLDGVWAECKRVLCNGGRIVVNIANKGRKPYDFACSDVVSRLTDKHGFMMRGDVIWDKGASAGVSTAWVSWRSASNPTLRDVHEHILIFSKASWKLESKNRISTISPDEFCSCTKSIWSMKTANRISNHHPAPFPLDLPRRLIQLYTYVGDTVLDPFLGSGTTCVTAKSLARKSIGYEIDPSYKEIINSRLTTIESLAFEARHIKTNGKLLEGRLGVII